MSLFKSNFMNLIEAFLQDKGFRVNMCQIYTKGVDYYESYKRVIMCAYKDDLLLCIRARSGSASDPFTGSDDQIEKKLQEPALKLLSCIKALHEGVDEENCKEFQGLKAVPIIIMEKASRNHPLFYYYDGETRKTKLWYKKKNVIFIPWEWMKNYWNDDFAHSILEQGFEVSEPQENIIDEHIVNTVKEIEAILASKRMGILKTLHLDKPTLPPLAVNLTKNEVIMIFLIDEEDELIHPKLMDYAVHHYSLKQAKFPEMINAVFFNIITEDKNENYIKPYIPNDSAKVRETFDSPIVIKTTVKGFENLIEIADVDEIGEIGKLTEISDTSMSELLKSSTGYFFNSVFDEAKRRIRDMFSEKCPFCDQSSSVQNNIPDYLLQELNIEVEISKDNSYCKYCNEEKNGCGWGIIVLNDLHQGGIHAFKHGIQQEYNQEIQVIKDKIKKEGLKIQSIMNIRLD